MANRMDLNGWYKLRWQILERDRYVCQYCGQGAPDVKLEVDHKIALADGGTNDPSNLVTSCWACNRGKSGLRQSIILRRERKNLRRASPKTVYAPIGSNQTAYRQTQVFNLLKNNRSLSINQISEICKITTNNADMVLKRLRKKGLVRRVGHAWNVLPQALSK
jgi:hypothetical protein